MTNPQQTPRIGIQWAKIPVGKVFRYKGTAKGAKTQSWRSNIIHAPKRFRSFCRNGLPYIERVA